jgi:hypothetical protein
MPTQRRFTLVARTFATPSSDAYLQSFYYVNERATTDLPVRAGAAKRPSLGLCLDDPDIHPVQEPDEYDPKSDCVCLALAFDMNSFEPGSSSHLASLKMRLLAHAEQWQQASAALGVQGDFTDIVAFIRGLPDDLPLNSHSR